MSLVDETIINDPENYKRLAVDRPLAELHKDMQAFAEGVRALRIQHRLPEVLLIMAGYTLDAHDEREVIFAANQMGNSLFLPLYAEVFAGLLEQAKAATNTEEAPNADEA